VEEGMGVLVRGGLAPVGRGTTSCGEMGVGVGVEGETARREFA